MDKKKINLLLTIMISVWSILFIIALLPNSTADINDGAEVILVANYSMKEIFGINVDMRGIVSIDDSTYYINDGFGNAIWETNASFTQDISHSVLIEGLGNPDGLTMNTTDFWVTDTADDRVYNLNESYNNRSVYDMGNNPFGVVMNDSNLFVINFGKGSINVWDFGGNNIYNITCDGFWECATAYAITTIDGSAFWVIEGDGDKLRKILPNGSTDSFRILTNVGRGAYGSDFKGITTTDGDTFYLTDFALDYIHQVRFNGTDAPDYAAPTVTINTPTEGSSYDPSDSIDFNVTATDSSSIDTCLYSLDGGTNNVTMTNETFQDDYNHTNISIGPGAYTMNVYCNDTLGNLNSAESVSFSVDVTPPSITNFKFFALNGSEDLIGTDETAFNISNYEMIEHMIVNFTLTDVSGFTGDIGFYYTANGSGACALGNNQSAICYNFEDNLWVEVRNGTDTHTFRDMDGGASGDILNCSWMGTSTQRNYTCLIDEHYNPNVWKHYPLNFSDMKWQSGSSERIKKNTIWKIEIDTGDIPIDADYYKIDFRVNATFGLAPTHQLLTYLCNSTYTTGNPETSPYCQLVGSRLPSELTDDGTKAREIFEATLIQNLGDIKYALIESDAPTSKYYSMKTYKYLGSAQMKTSISNDNGGSYTNLSDGYETELNINWIYMGTGTDNVTQTILKIHSNDSLGNNANSTDYVMTWLSGALNEKPVLDIINPEIFSNYSGDIEINWTTAEPDGDLFVTNITANNGTDTITIATNQANNINNYTWDTTGVSIGNWNITLISCENETVDLFCGNDTHEIGILDTISPQITINQPTANQTFENFVSSITIDANFTATDINLETCKYEVQGPDAIGNITISCQTAIARNFTYSLLQSGIYKFIVYVNDSAGNFNSTDINFTVNSFTGDTGGGGGGGDSGSGNGSFTGAYNRTLFCLRAGVFRNDHTLANGTLSFAENDFNLFKNNLVTEIGMGVEDGVLEPFINDYETNCPDFIKEEVKEIIEEEKGFNNLWFIIIAIAVLILIFFIIVLMDRKNVMNTARIIASSKSN